jgi:hypothetical protein
MVIERARPTELWCLVFHHQYPYWYTPHVPLRFGEPPSKDKLFLFSDWFQTTGGPAVMVWGFIVVGEGSFHCLRFSDLPVSNSLFHNVGRLGYGRYVLPAGTWRFCVCNVQLQRYAAHIRPVAAHISGRPCFPSLKALPSRPGSLVGSTFWGKLR